MVVALKHLSLAGLHRKPPADTVLAQKHQIQALLAQLNTLLAQQHQILSDSPMAARCLPSTSKLLVWRRGHLSRLNRSPSPSLSPRSCPLPSGEGNLRL